MNILFITPVTHDACSFYRTGGIAPDLAKKLNANIHVTSLDKESFEWQKLSLYDLVMFQRPYSKMTLELGRYIKELGIPLWVDFDDLQLALPPSNPAYEIHTTNRMIISQIAGIADAVSVTTKPLAEQMTKLNKNVRLIPNAFNDTILSERKAAPRREKTVLWRGGDSHVMDLIAYSEPISMVMEEFKEYSFAYMGMLPWCLYPTSNMKHLPATDPVFYFKTISNLAPTVIHVPLENSLFNQCKSNIAFIEGAYAGAACIGPDWAEWQVPGVLNYTDTDSYYAHLHNVLTGEVNVKKLADQAWEYITDNLMLSKVNEKRVELVKSLI